MLRNHTDADFAQEALARECVVHSNLGLETHIYQSAMRAQALLLADLRKNLVVFYDAIRKTDLHLMCKYDASYGSLLQATCCILTMIELIPNPASPPDELCAWYDAPMPTKDDVAELRRMIDRATELCHGDASKGITGWRECYGTVKELTEG